MRWTAVFSAWKRRFGDRSRRNVRRSRHPELQCVESRLLLSGAVSVVTKPLFSGGPADISTALMATTRDGTLWVALDTSDRAVIDRVKPDGTVTTYAALGTDRISGITPGPGGNIWFTSYRDDGRSYVGRITPDGRISEFLLKLRGFAYNIVAGPDGNLWFSIQTQAPSGFFTSVIGRATPQQMVTYFPIPSTAKILEVDSLVVGPDRNLWFTAQRIDGAINYIGRMTPAGAVTMKPFGIGPVSAVAAGLGGTLVVVGGHETPKVGQVTASEHVRYFPIPRRYLPAFQGSGFPATPVASGGSLWFVNAGKISRITASGGVAQYPLSSFIASPHNDLDTLAGAPDGSIYFLDWSTGQVDRLSPSAFPPLP